MAFWAYAPDPDDPVSTGILLSVRESKDELLDMYDPYDDGLILIWDDEARDWV